MDDFVHTHKSSKGLIKSMQLESNYIQRVFLIDEIWKQSTVLWSVDWLYDLDIPTSDFQRKKANKLNSFSTDYCMKECIISTAINLNWGLQNILNAWKR